MEYQEAVSVGRGRRMNAVATLSIYVRERATTALVAQTHSLEHHAQKENAVTLLPTAL
jgi:hypothetical protein